MHRINRRGIQPVHGPQDFRQLFVRVRVFLTVAGQVIEFRRSRHRLSVKVHHGVSFLPADSRAVVEEGIVHGIAHNVGFLRQALCRQERRCRLGAGHQAGGYMVGNDAVHLFRAVQGAEPVARLHMIHGDVELHRRQCRRQGGIGITIHQQLIRPLLQQYFFDGRQHFARHGTVASAGNAQIIVRLGNIQFFKEDIGHIVVIVLPGMHQHLLCLLPQQSGHHRRFDKLRPCAHNG